MFKIVYHTLRKLGVDEKGASAVEYAILVGCIGAVLAVGANKFAGDLSNVFKTLITKVDFTGNSA